MPNHRAAVATKRQPMMMIAASLSRRGVKRQGASYNEHERADANRNHLAGHYRWAVGFRVGRAWGLARQYP
jgi:hypothetical protein